MTQITQEAKKTLKHRRALLQGNEAVVEGALAAGMRFFAGYPITPSTEIAEGCALKLPRVGGKFIQMEDELASMAAVIGASVAGVKSMTATSGPGFSLKQENIGFAALAEIPCVVVDVQRSGPSTGLPTSPSQGDYMQARWGTHGDHPHLHPGEGAAVRRAPDAGDGVRVARGRWPAAERRRGRPGVRGHG